MYKMDHILHTGAQLLHHVHMDFVINPHVVHHVNNVIIHNGGEHIV